MLWVGGRFCPEAHLQLDLAAGAADQADGLLLNAVGGGGDAVGGSVVVGREFLVIGRSVGQRGRARDRLVVGRGADGACS
jgi:hypothetical protein